MGKIKQQNRQFDVDRMSKDLLLPMLEIKRILNLPLGRNYKYPNAASARIACFSAKTGSQKQTQALQAWITLFLKEVGSIKNRQQAMELYKIAPPDDAAKKAIIGAIAHFYGFNGFSGCNILLNSAKTLEQAIGIAFKHLPPGQRFSGPQGKLVLQRNGVETGPMAEVFATKLRRRNKAILFTAYWRGKRKLFLLKAHWRQKGETLEKWNEQW